MANRLMFEVGIKKANDQYDQIYQEVKNLVELGGKGIPLKINFQSTTELNTFVNALKSVGDGKLLEPLLNKIEQLQMSMVRLGLVPKDIDYSALEKQLSNVTARYEAMIAARNKAGLKDGEPAVSGAPMAMTEAYRVARGNLEKEFGMTENVARSVMDTYKNMGNTIQESLSRIGTGTSSATKQANAALEQESAAVSDTVQKLNNLVLEKQQVVNAEKKLAESSEQTTKSLTREGDKAGETSDKLKKTQNAIAETAQETEKATTQMTTSRQKYNAMLAETEKLLMRVNDIISKGGKTPLLDTAARDLSNFQNKVINVDRNDKNAVSLALDEFNRLSKIYGQITAEAEKSYAARVKAADKAAQASEKAAEKTAKSEAKAAEQAEKENKKWAESMDYARTKANELRIIIEKLQSVEQSGLAKGLDVSGLSAQIEKLKQNLQTLYGMAGGAKMGGTAQEFIGSSTFKVPIDTARQYASEIEKITPNVSTLTTEQRKLAQALNQTTHEMKGQSQIMSDLKMMATQYLGVWGAQGFVKNIIEIGGQLEMQRMSIGSILQNTAQANNLFDKIKGLAVKSPFGVVELDQMTKQLTAYGFKYHELFDMTKRLADISAATGTSVDRLALALGHVRSEAALSGYTLRQFAMGNVPLLAKLSEKLGKSTEEIRKMVRTKGISYEDVLGILKDLTNKGGMFYNMQEVISESVKAKFKNVKDAMAIMYGEMAEGAPGDALKELAKALMEVTTNWRDMATIIMTGSAAWGIHRVAVLAYSKVLGAANTQTIASIAAFRKKEAALLRSAMMYRSLDAAEKSMIATSKLYTTQERLRMILGMQFTQKQQTRIAYARQQRVMDLALALSEKALVTEDIARQVALGQLTKAEATQIVMLADLTNAERAAALSAINNVRTYGKFTGVINGASMAIGKLATSLKALFFNPQMLLMAGITAMVELWQRNAREMEQAKELSDKIYDNSQEALKNTRSVLSDTGIQAMWRKNVNSGEDFSNVTSKFGNQAGGQYYFELPKFDAEEAKSSIDRWTQYIRDYAATPNRMLNEALYDTEGNVLSLKEQFDNLKVSVSQVAEAQVLLRDLAPAFENAVNASDGGIFDDNVVTNIKDYDKAIKGFGNDVATSYRKYTQSIDGGIEAAKEQDEAFAKAVDSMETYAQQYDFLIKNQEKYSKAVNAFKDLNSRNEHEFKVLSGSQNFFGLGGYGLEDVQAAEKKMQDDLETFYLQLAADLQTKGYNLNNLTIEQQQAMLLGYKEKLSSIQGLSEETANELMRLFAKRFGIEVDLDDEKFQIKKSEIEMQLEELIGRKWTVPINFTSNITNVIDEARKKYKIATEYFNNVKPILVKFGIKWEIGQMFTDKQIEDALAKVPEEQREFLRKVMSGVNEATNIFKNATDASQAGGFSLEDPNKNKGKKKKPGSGGSKEDLNAKAVREKVRVVKEAADAFVYWRDKVGDRGAWDHVLDEFGEVLGKIGITADNITDLKGNLNGILNTKEFKAIKDQKVKTEIQKEIAKENDKLRRKDFEKSTEDFASKVQKELDALTRAWDIFNNVRNATGDVELAVRLSGADYAGGKNRNLADALKEKIRSDFEKSGAAIDFNVELSDKQVEELVKDLIPKEGEERIKGLIEEYKKWRDLQKEVLKGDIDVFLKVREDQYDTRNELNKVADAYRRNKESLDNLLSNFQSGSGLGISEDEYNRALKRATSTMKWGEFKANNNYNWIMDNISTTSLYTIKKMVSAMREFANTTELSAEETKAWQEAMDKLTDRETVLDPLKAITDTVTDYNNAVARRKGAEEQWRIANMSRVERKRQGISDDQVKDKNVAEQEYLQALSNEERALQRVKKAILEFNSSIKTLGSSLSQLGDTIGGKLGDVLNGLGGMIGDLGGSIDSIASVASSGKTGIAGGLEKVSAVVGVVSAMVSMNQKLDSILPNTESMYEHYAEKQRKVNEMRRAIDDYYIASMKKQIEDENWLYTNGLSEMRTNGYLKKNLLDAYANTLLEPQEIYQESRSGLAKWGPAIVGAIVGIVVGALTLGSGSAVAAVAYSSLATALGSGVAATAVGAALAAGVGAAINTALARTGEAIFYKEGQTAAIANMRVQTQHSSFWRGEKTQDLQDWTRENYGKELFDKDNYYLVDVELAKSILDSGVTLAGDTRQTLERLVDIAEQINEIQEQAHEYVSQMFSPLVDNMTDALWEWLSDGKDMLDSFEDYASDTFKKIAQDAVKSFLKINLLDKYQTQLDKLATAYSLGVYNEQQYGLAVASVAGDIKRDYQALIPTIQILGNTLADAFDLQGYDIVGKSGSSSSTNSISGITEQTADLLASYLNAVRADVSVNREYITEYFPMYYAALTSSNASLRVIEQRAVEIAISNEAIRENTEFVATMMNGLRNNTWKVPVA